MESNICCQSPDSQIPISPKTRDKAEFAKAYIELRYANKKSEEMQNIESWNQLAEHMDSQNLSNYEKKQLKDRIFHQEGRNLRESRKRASVFEYEPEALIGRGGFGEVYLVRHRKTQELFALKKVSKDLILNKNQIDHIRSERSALAVSTSDWVVELKSSFQDDHFLYFLMEYVPGGDFMSLLIKRKVLTEPEARFYLAELVLAVDSVHKLNYIHRDLKPDNILIGRNGHVKLADFGLCKRSQIYPATQVLSDPSSPKHRDSRLNYTTVGSPDYIAPEIYMKQGYDEGVDWWSLGVIFYEMIFGYPPFYASDLEGTSAKIVDWENHLYLPQDQVSAEAADLLAQLICSKETRLQDASLIKSHPFFADINWQELCSCPAPWVPELDSETDTKYFDSFEEISSFYPPIPIHVKPKKTDSNFVGFEYKRQNSDESRLSSAIGLLVKTSRRASLTHCQTDSDTP